MPMTPERWRRVEELHHAALARDARDRALLLGEPAVVTGHTS